MRVDNAVLIAQLEKQLASLSAQLTALKAEHDSLAAKWTDDELAVMIKAGVEKHAAAVRLLNVMLIKIPILFL